MVKKIAIKLKAKTVPEHTESIAIYKHEPVYRLVQQLEFQTTANIELAQRCALLKSQLALLMLSEQRFTSLIENASCCFFALNKEGLITDCNKRATQLFKQPKIKIIDKRLLSYILPEEQKRALALFKKVVEEGYFGINEFSFMRKKSITPIPIEISGSLIDNGKTQEILLVVNDLSERKKTENRLHTQQAVSQLLSEINNLEEAAPRILKIMCENLRWDSGELWILNRELKYLSCFAIWHKPAPEWLEFDRISKKMVFKLGDGIPGQVWERKQPLWIEDLPDIWIEDRPAPTLTPRARVGLQMGLRTAFGFPILDENDEILGIFVFFSKKNLAKDQELIDIFSMLRTQFSLFMQRKLAEEKIEYLAFHDPLTGLPNRDLLEIEINRAILNAQRAQTHLAVLLLDLDRFKQINDALGHAFGDKLLKKVAAKLARCMRGTDLLARPGGDEFVILLTELSSIETAVGVVQKINQELSCPFEIDNHEFTVSFSIGISTYPEDGDDGITLLKQADSAMFRAKELGRNNYQFYTEKMTKLAQEQLDIEESLRTAIPAKEFVVTFQPKINLQTNEITGFEALIRWQHSQKGLLLPARFITVAEDTGLILPIGDWVLENACKQRKLWSKFGLSKTNLAVNLSPRQFYDQDMVQKIINTIEENKVDPQVLQLEITERMIMQDLKKAIVAMHQLTEIGIQLAIDDFGTGYSSLNYLVTFPIKTLKVDKSFVQNITINKRSRTMIKAIIAMARNLDISVVAEGVETFGQYEYLREHHCEQMQGFYFCKPLQAKELLKFLAKLKKKQTFS